MMFAPRNNQSHKRIISDVRPGGAGKLSPLRLVQEKEKPPRRSPPRGRERGVSRSRWMTVGSVLSVVVALGLYIAFTHAMTLTITPKKTRFDLGSGVTLTVPAEEFSTSLAKRGESQSLGERSFSEKARGTIVVYNNYNGEGQTLLATTRFEAPSGLIYRSRSRVTVPGKVGDKPGSVEIEVEADKAGEQYNLGLSDFTIPGFAGSAKFHKFYARSKTEIQGGKTGFGKVVGSREADELFGKLEKDMQEELEGALQKALPEDVLVLPAAFEFSTLERLTDPPLGSHAETFFGEVRGVGQTLAPRKNVFADKLASVLFKDQYQVGAYTLRDDDSNLTFKNMTLQRDQKTITVTVEGRAVFEWIFNEAGLKKRVLEAENNAALKGVFDSYAGISRVEVTFRPYFFKRIPRRDSRVILEIRR